VVHGTGRFAREGVLREGILPVFEKLVPGKNGRSKKAKNLSSMKIRYPRRHLEKNVN